MRPPRAIRSTDGTRNTFNTHSLFRGRDSAIAVPLTYGVVTMPDGQRVCEGSVTCPLLYEGPPGGVHGGYLAGLFDDVLGGTQQLIEGPSGLTGTLSVRYRALTPLETELHFRGWIDHVSGAKSTSSSASLIALALAAPSPRIASATCFFVR